VCVCVCVYKERINHNLASVQEQSQGGEWVHSDPMLASALEACAETPPSLRMCVNTANVICIDHSRVNDTDRPSV
jgi:hypothetical protein